MCFWQIVQYLSIWIFFGEFFIVFKQIRNVSDDVCFVWLLLSSRLANRLETVFVRQKFPLQHPRFSWPTNTKRTPLILVCVTKFWRKMTIMIIISEKHNNACWSQFVVFSDIFTQNSTLISFNSYYLSKTQNQKGYFLIVMILLCLWHQIWKFIFHILQFLHWDSSFSLWLLHFFMTFSELFPTSHHLLETKSDL